MKEYQKSTLSIRDSRAVTDINLVGIELWRHRSRFTFDTIRDILKIFFFVIYFSFQRESKKKPYSSSAKTHSTFPSL